MCRYSHLPAKITDILERGSIRLLSYYVAELTLDPSVLHSTLLVSRPAFLNSGVLGNRDEGG